MDRLTFQIERIKAILADDKNYQVDSLKIGAIWDICDRTASYKRGKDISGRDFIEVLPPGQSLSQEAVREEALSGIIDELAAIADACVDLQQNRKRPDSDPVMGWDNALLTLGTLRKARALKREPNAAAESYEPAHPKALDEPAPAAPDVVRFRWGPNGMVADPKGGYIWIDAPGASDE